MKGMNGMNFIVENWPCIVAAIAIIAVVVIFAVRFFKGSYKEQLEKIREWLIYATAEAEKELGGGTGKLKLRYVYDAFVTKFAWFAKIISFERFSELVDEALVSLNEMLQTNSAINTYINGASNETES